jgi:hypothetical protein
MEPLDKRFFREGLCENDEQGGGGGEWRESMERTLLLDLVVMC